MGMYCINYTQVHVYKASLCLFLIPATVQGHAFIWGMVTLTLYNVPSSR